MLDCKMQTKGSDIDLCTSCKIHSVQNQYVDFAVV